MTGSQTPQRPPAARPIEGPPPLAASRVVSSQVALASPGRTEEADMKATSTATEMDAICGMAVDPRRTGGSGRPGNHLPPPPAPRVPESSR